jgi:hypothetical protein
MNQKHTQLTVAAIAITSVLLTIAVLAALSDSTTIPVDGTINTVNVEAYSDSSCTQPVTTISLDNVSPGGSVSETIYIKNSGSVTVTLTMDTSGWSPVGASSYLTLSWNRQNDELAAGASVPATLTLTAASDTGSLTTFSCSMTITGTE